MKTDSFEIRQARNSEFQGGTLEFVAYVNIWASQMSFFSFLFKSYSAIFLAQGQSGCNKGACLSRTDCANQEDVLLLNRVVVSSLSLSVGLDSLDPKSGIIQARCKILTIPHI